MKPLVSRDSAKVRATLRLPSVASANGGEGMVNSAKGPAVETIKENGKVVRMIVTCSCGEKIEVDCVYPDGK